jgi:hypothetical protein
MTKQREGFMTFCDALKTVRGLANHYVHGDQLPPEVEGEDAIAMLDRWQLALNTVDRWISSRCSRS